MAMPPALMPLFSGPIAIFTPAFSDTMAVYTHLNHSQIATVLAPYGIGTLVDFRGINGGVENTNYFVTTVKGNEQREFVLTLFEDLAYDELPYFVALTDHLSAHGIIVPAPIRDQDNIALRTVAGRPALLFTRFAGDHLPRNEITEQVCSMVGAQLANMHVASQSFTLHRTAHRGRNWWQELAPRAMHVLTKVDGDILAQAVSDYDKVIEAYPELPMGVIHGDLFHDNILFDQQQLSAIIDLYNASNDCLLFDIAIAVNDWCIYANGDINTPLYEALLNAYASKRPFSEAEQQCWPTMLRAAAMRFWLSRLETYHGLDQHQREEGVTVLKDPDTFRDILAKHREQSLHLPV